MSWVWRTPIAHRGLHDADAGIPENSLPALEAAARAGFPVEIDVRLTGDGQPAVVHDADLLRVAGVDVRVASSEMARLREPPLLGTDAHVPSLPEALEALAGRVPVLLDMKSRALRVGALERAVTDCCRDAGADWAVASFDPRTVGWFARHAPGVVRGHTMSTASGAVSAVALRALVRARIVAPATRAHFLAHDLAGLPNRFVRFWRARGLPVVGWTARTRAGLRRAREVADNVMFEDVSSDALDDAGFHRRADR